MGLLREPRKTIKFENRHSPYVAGAIFTPRSFYTFPVYNFSMLRGRSVLHHIPRFFWLGTIEMFSHALDFRLFGAVDTQQQTIPVYPQFVDQPLRLARASHILWF